MTDDYDALDAGVAAERRGEVDSALGHYRVAEASTDPWLRSEVLRRQSVIHRNRSEWDEALDLARRAAEVAAAASLREQEAEARNAEATVYLARGEFDTALDAFEAVLALSRDSRIRGMALQNIGSIAAQRGEWELARHRFMASVKCFQQAGYERGVAIAHNNYGGAALEHGNYVLAEDLLAQAVASAKRAEDPDLTALATMNHAEAIAGVGDLDRAERLLDGALEHFRRAGNAWREVEALRIRGDIGRRRDDHAAARAHYREALAIAERIGAQVEIEQLRKRLAEPTPPSK
ncbi:MAG TPA: tetratricopeptide repeat protein [Gemmatimonadaceae bacterium]